MSASVVSASSASVALAARSSASLRGGRAPGVMSPVTRPPRSPRGGLTVLAAKGRNARLAGRDKKAQRREDDKMLDGVERAAEKRADKRAAKTKREPGLKYSKRGKVSSQPGQVSKAALKRIREATAASKAVEEVDEQRAAEKRQEYQRAQSRGIPQAVTDRMLKRISIFSGVPLLLGFTTGPTFYALKVFAHVDVAPWQFFFVSTATFGAALVGITYGVMSASWEPAREGTFWGVEEIRANIPVLLQNVAGKAAGKDGSDFPDEWDDGEP